MECRQLDVHQPGAHGLVGGERLADAPLHAGLGASLEPLARHPDAQPARPVLQPGQVVGHRARGGGLVAGIVAGDGAEQRGRVGHGASQGPDLVERAGEGHHAVARDPAVGGLQADHAAERGGLADRAAGVGAEAPKTCRAATAAALPPDDPPGVRVRSQGFRHGPKALFSLDEPMANSSMLSLPTRTAPAPRSRSTTVASKGGMKPARMREPAGGLDAPS